MSQLDPETNITVKRKDLQELQEIWWGFEGLQKLLELMGNDQGSLGVYYIAKPLFTRLDGLCFGGPLDANMVEPSPSKSQDSD